MPRGVDGLHRTGHIGPVRTGRGSGFATAIVYRSDKWNDGIHDYEHKIEADDAEVDNRDDRNFRVHHPGENIPDRPGGHTRSSTIAIPCPTPMHMVQSA